jgi:hypothetical protein
MSQNPTVVTDSLNVELKKFKTISLNNSEFNVCPKGYSEKMIDELANEIFDKFQKSGLDSAKALVVKMRKKYKSDLEEILKKINNTKYPFAKEGFMLEFAAAEAILFQNNHWNESIHAKSAIWLTPSYRWDVSNQNEEVVSLIDLMGVFRYSFNNKKDSVDVSDYFDAGIKGKYIHNRWSLALEGVYRYATDVDEEQLKRNYTYRFTASLDYKINDLLTFKATFGTTFNGNTTTYTDPKEIFAIGGINVGLFDPRHE